MSAVTCFLMLDKESHSSRSTEPKVSHQGNLAERIIHYNLHGGVDNGISGIIIPCQPPRGDYNGLSFPLNFPDGEDNDTKLLGHTLALGTCPLFIHSCNISGGGLTKDIFPENCRVVCPEPRGLSCIIDVAASDEQGGINAGVMHRTGLVQ